MKNFNYTVKFFCNTGCLILLMIITTPSNAQVTPPSWLDAFGSPPTGGSNYEEGEGIAAGNDGFIYVGSRYVNSGPLVTYGMAGHTISPPNSNGSTNVSCTKFTNQLWAAGWSTDVSPAGYNYGGNMGIDQNNNTYIVGVVNSGNGWFCTKTNTGGVIQWTYRCNYYLGTWNIPNGVCIDKNNNSYVCGNYQIGNIVIGATTLTRIGTEDGFLTQLSPSGIPHWAIPLHTVGCSVNPYGVALDYNGNLWVCGGYTGAPTFGSINLPSEANNSLFVTEIDTSNGNVLQVYTAANAGPGIQLCIDSCNNIYVAGQFQGAATWGTFSATSSANGAYVTKLCSSTGHFQWVQTGIGAGNAQGSGISIDKNWDITIDGYFTGATTFSGITFSSNLTSASSSNNTFIAKYASGDGSLMYVQQGGGPSPCNGYYITTDANRQAYCTGTYGGYSTAPTFGANTLPVGSGCACNIYVAKIDSTPNLQIIPDPQNTYCSGQCYTLPITTIGTFTAGNVFTAQLSDATGSFAAGGTNIGTLTSTTSGIINICISAALPAGTNYLLRVTSSNPNYCSIVRCNTITINDGPTVTLSPAPNICMGTSATLTASGGVSYTWSTGATTSSITVSPVTTTTYTVGVSNGTCSKDTSIVVTVNPTPTVTLTAPAEICSGGSGIITATASGGTAPYIYSWTPSVGTTSSISVSPSSTQTYTINITDANGCTASAETTVNVGGTLVVSAGGTTSLCAGATGTLCATIAGGSGGNTFLWQPGNLTTPCITISPAVSTTYTVTVQDACGSTININVPVNVNPAPVVNFTADLYQGCAPLCTQFINNTTLSSGRMAAFNWAFGNGDTLSSQEPLYCYPSGGKYNVTLTVTSDSGCSSTLKKTEMITVFNHPVASFTYSPQPISILTPTVQFTNNSTDTYGGISSWYWTFGDSGDSTSSMLENPSHTYQDTGMYCTKLVVMNMHGCMDTTTQCLEISPAFNLYIPSAFTPNSDGLNDVFMAKGNYVKSFEMYIYDRWGMELFHSNDINTGWNGTVHGSATLAQEDTYIYRISVTDTQDNIHSYTGNVTLLK